MKHLFAHGITVALLGFCATTCLAGDLADYLTNEGQLKESITLRIGGFEFLAPPDEVCTIQPNGEWNWEFTEAQGRFNSQQLRALALHLATQDFRSLPKHQGYQPKAGQAGYEYVIMTFGKKSAAFYTKIGQTRTDYLPDAGDADASAWSRFIALELALTDMLEKSEAEQGKAD